MEDMADTVEGRRLEMSGFGECDVDKVPPLEAWGDVGRMAVLGVVSAFSKFGEGDISTGKIQGVCT